MMVDYGKYRNIIFDFDGVVVDSNFIVLVNLRVCEDAVKRAEHTVTVTVTVTMTVNVNLL